MLQEHDKRQDPVSQLGDILTFKTVPQPPLDTRCVTHLASQVMAGGPENPQAALLAADSMRPGLPYIPHPLSSTWQKWRHTQSAHANKAKVTDLSPTHPATYLIIHPPTHPTISLSIHPSIQLYTNLPIHPSIHSSTYTPTHPPRYSPTHPSLHLLTHPPTYTTSHSTIQSPMHPPTAQPIQPSTSQAIYSPSQARNT